MNSPKYKIQALIAEIDEVLSKPVPRLPWTGSIDTVHQRQLLERVRTYLVSPESKLVAAQKSESGKKVRPAPVPVPKVPPPVNRPSATEQILVAVTGEISHLRESLMQPLQEDIQALRQEQQALVQEIQQLEAKRQQQQSLAQQQANQQQVISEFLQALTNRLEETWVRDVSQTSRSVETQFLQGSAAPALGSASNSTLDLNAPALGEHPLLTPAQRLEQMQLFQAQADSLLMRLDSTMSIVFDALQGNLQSYQESLSQGLERMHGLSQQSEVMFAALVNHLAAELGREASSYVQPQLDRSNNLDSATPTAVDRTPTSPMLPNTARSEATTETPIPDRVPENRSTSELGEQERLPYAGTEISPQFGQLKRDRDRTHSLISLPDLEENLFGSQPQTDRPVTLVPEVETEDRSAESGENVEDLYASLFAGEEVVELELEDFTIENTETVAETESVQSQAPPADEIAEPINATVDLFANLLNEDESLEDFLVGEDSDFVIANSVGELTLDTPNLLEPEVAAIPEISEPLAPTTEPQLDIGDREQEDTTPDRSELLDSAAAESQSRSAPLLPLPPVLGTATEVSSTGKSASPRVPSARDVQTGDFGSDRLDDAYIQASPDENLLPINESEEEIDRSLNLDNNTLQLLEADLYSMEGWENASPGRSQPSVGVNSRQFANSLDEAENPFAGAVEEELGTLDELFAEVLGDSSEDESLGFEEELEGNLFAEAEDSNMSLDDILASLTTEQSSVSSADSGPETTGGTKGQRSTPAENKKKI
ncbi:MAG: hypothetical protein HC789_00900 [Microcoleus sp. CSU_2_2]|nr:hypothetical protein [Microcoleus sp. SU_5_3]NJS09021.1 hypothetical protein [Microcoleus sp. CSU_2_2]